MTELPPSVTAAETSRTVEQIGGRVADGLERLFGAASSAAVFSAPQPVGDSVVITAVAWERAGGFGFGGGSGPGDEGTGGGGGGGGSSVGRPVAVVRVGPGGIEVKPIIDVTKIGITVLLSALGVWRILRR
jgi:uncharacterized spore protein YtfJ